MFKTLKKAQKGFTIIELLIVIAIIAILATIVLVTYNGAQAKARDSKRVSDINSIQTKLEEYYNENGSYPAAVNTTDIKGLDAGALKDPRGNALSNTGPSADAAAATTAAAVDATTHNYAYSAYPATCTTAANDCTGFVLKSYIEKPNTTTTNPLVKTGLNNN